MELTQRRLLLEKERSMCRRDCRFEMLHVEKRGVRGVRWLYWPFFGGEKFEKLNIKNAV